jgi:ferritin-like protein
VTVSLSRAQLFSRGAKGGAALLLSGSVAGSFARSSAADSIPDGDLAYARLLVGAELLASDFYTRAIASKQVGGDALKYLKRALFNEQEHYQSVSGILTGAGQTPAVAADFDFSYPKETFRSKASIVKLGVALETTFLGSYLGAVDALQTNALKQPAARIAASEAEHLSVFTQLSGGDPIGISLPSALTIDEASSALDAFAS